MSFGTDLELKRTDQVSASTSSSSDDKVSMKAEEQKLNMSGRKAVISSKTDEEDLRMLVAGKLLEELRHQENTQTLMQESLRSQFAAITASINAFQNVASFSALHVISTIKPNIKQIQEQNKSLEQIVEVNKQRIILATAQKLKDLSKKKPITDYPGLYT